MTPRTLFAPARVVLLALVAAVPVLLLQGQAMAAGADPTTLVVAAPAKVSVGQKVEVQAKLTTASGPVVKATVQFVLPMSFFNTTADMVVASGLTDGQGLATATFQARSTGDLKVKAVFAGDASHAASNATAPMSVTGSTQLYKPDLGVRLRGLTSSPISSDNGVTDWVLSGWPIGALLVIIWGTYATAIYFMSRISADAAATEMEVSR